MNEEAARAWLTARYAADRIAMLERFVSALRAEAETQSLIARSTFESVWARHIVDSAQLVDLGAPDGAWLDIGSGGGLPGIVIAVLRDAPITLSEPRRKRAEFLDDVVAALGLRNVTVEARKAQAMAGAYRVVSARAVAPIAEILAWSHGVVSRETHFVLPRGRNWQEDVALARRTWHGAFHVEQSVTDPLAGIVTAQDVRLR